MPYFDSAYDRTIPGSGAERAAFIRRTYVHLALAILAFVGIEYALLYHSPLPGIMWQWLAGGGGGRWLMILGGFVVGGWLARGFAGASRPLPLQYLGLALYVVLQAVIFLPLMLFAAVEAPEAIRVAAILTLLLFAGLTGTVFINRTDFSFLGSFLMIGGFVALGLIVCGAIFGFNLGLVFSAGMVILAAGAILYDTSNVLHHFRTDQHVGAALELFASVALLFFYILRIVLAVTSRR